LGQSAIAQEVNNPDFSEPRRAQGLPPVLSSFATNALALRAASHLAQDIREKLEQAEFFPHPADAEY
jgi:hypothetical protein